MNDSHSDIQPDKGQYRDDSNSTFTNATSLTPLSLKDVALPFATIEMSAAALEQLEADDVFTAFYPHRRCHF